MVLNPRNTSIHHESALIIRLCHWIICSKQDTLHYICCFRRASGIPLLRLSNVPTRLYISVEVFTVAQIWSRLPYKFEVPIEPSLAITFRRALRRAHAELSQDWSRVNRDIWSGVYV